MKRFFALFFLLTAFTINCAAQTAPTSATQPTSKIINASQLLDDLRTLSEDKMQGRAPDTAGSRMARELIVNRFKKINLRMFGDSYIQPFVFGAAKTNAANVIGYVEGKTNPKKYIVATAHYDHEGIKNGQIYNGADDNASGTAALMTLAEYFAKNRPAHSIIFVAFDAEEKNLQGAKKFMEKPPVEKSAIAMNVNMDMISRDAENELYAAGTFHYPFLKPYLEKIKVSQPVQLRFGYDSPQAKDDWTIQSDHAAFHAQKIPFIYFGVENHADYHEPTDDFERIMPAFYVGVVETIIEAVKSFDLNLVAIAAKRDSR